MLPLVFQGREVHLSEPYFMMDEDEQGVPAERQAGADQGNIEVQRKKLCKSCIFDCNDRNPELSSPKGWDSWTRLVQAAEISGNHHILMIAAKADSGRVPEVFYHNQCRNRFNKKRDLGDISETKDTEDPPDATAKPKIFHRRESSAPFASTVYEPVCIFCLKSSKYLKGTNTRDQLVKCVDLHADGTVREAAIRKEDGRIIAILSRELVGAEGHYHGQCYRAFTRPLKKVTTDDNNNSTTETEPDPDVIYGRAAKRTYEELFKYIRNHLFQQPNVVRLTELTKKLTDTLLSMGVTEVKSSTKKHIQRKLVAEFGESLHMIPDDKGKILVFPDNLSLGEVVKENVRLKEELQVFKENMSHNENMVKTVSLMLRNDVKMQETKMPWPPVPAQLEASSQLIPGSLNAFLRILFSGDSTICSGRVHRLVDSIGQDIVYGVTCSRLKPPKHILLPEAVKTLTGNVELIRILNRLGHGISYTQLEEADTALALQKLESQGTDGTILPEGIKSNVMTTLAWDNIDRLEETLSGGNTSHRVNGIVVQPKVFGPEAMSNLVVTI